MSITIHRSDSQDDIYEKIYEGIHEGEYDELVLETLLTTYDVNENKTLTDLFDTVADIIFNQEIGFRYYKEQDYLDDEGDQAYHMKLDE